MKKDKIDIVNSFQCKKSWYELDKTKYDEVRFCSQCEHNVYDIRNLSKSEVKLFIENYEDKKLCAIGKFDKNKRLITGDCVDKSYHEKDDDRDLIIIGHLTKSMMSGVDDKIDKLEKRTKQMKSLRDLLNFKDRY